MKKLLPILFIIGLVSAQTSVSGEREIPHAENREFVLDSTTQAVVGTERVAYLGAYNFRKAYTPYVKDSFQTSAFSNKILDFYHHDVLSLTDTFEIELYDSASGSSNFVFPIKGRVSSGFGPRYFWGYHFHYGTDITLVRGDTIVAAMDGTVRIVRVDRWGYGNFIVVTHKGGLETLYGHLDKSLAVEGQEVKAGDIIGLGGSTGRSTGPHLHFEFRFMGEQFDPEKVCSFEDGHLKCESMKIDRSWFGHLDRKKPTPMAINHVPQNAPAGSGSAVYHRITPGQNLGTIARLYNTTVSELCRLNGITPNTIIMAGKPLRVR